LVVNRPALPAVAYRVGVHTSFLRSMQSRLPSLRRLTTRDPSDPTLGLFDAFAAVGDVLTFYQERIANESYLRTATERFSLLQLSRLIDYQPRPGVTAEVYLSFALDDTPSSPATVTVPAGAQVQSVPGPGEKPETFETADALEAKAALNRLLPRSTAPAVLGPLDTQAYVVGASLGLRPGDGLLFEQSGATQRGGAAEAQHAFRRVVRTTSDHAAARTLLEWDEPLELPAPPAPDLQLFVFRISAALFGSNAPDPAAVVRGRQGAEPAPHLSLRPAARGGEADDWPGLSISAIAGASDSIYLDAVYPQIVPKSRVALVTPQASDRFVVERVADSARRGFTLSSKSSRLELSQGDLSPFDGAVRETVVYAASERLAFADAPLDEPVVREVTLDRSVETLAAGRKLIVAGVSALDGLPRLELAEVEQVQDDGGYTRLRFRADLASSLRRQGLEMYGNVVRATHGETSEEVLGSGDATQSFQRFVLSHAPVTFVAASTETGTASTLRVFVDDVAWREVPALDTAAAHDRVYVARLEPDGALSILFGDGQTGARLPTGVDNVRAVYRKGIGLEGMIKAGRMTVAITRPLGLKSVNNPLPASGAADPESLDQIRRNAPRGVLTLGRVVSLQDYTDFASSFAGIGKALATFTWDGSARTVFLTVAGAGGAAVPPGSALAESLTAALRRQGDPYVPLRVRSYRGAPFRIAATVKAESSRVASVVEVAILERLRAAFAFEARGFGEPVALSEAVSVIQGTPGVIAVDVDAFCRLDSPEGGIWARLPAAMPSAARTFGGPIVEAAELLVLDLRPLDIRVSQ
jgi:hypothetical protein